MVTNKKIDLVLEGGGVKVTAIVGALESIEAEGYTYDRIAGSSAGAIVASLVAAGYTSKELKEIFMELDYNRFADVSMLSKFGVVGKTFSLLLSKGIYDGKFIRQFVYDLLEKKGVRTFGDLKLATADESGTIHDDYKLVVLSADITSGAVVRFPWDYEKYGLNPDTQLVADAVRTSASLPFYYKPVQLGGHYLVDGGVISNFPIWIFEEDIQDEKMRNPAIGVKLSARPEAMMHAMGRNTSNTFTYGFSILKTITEAADQIHLSEQSTLERTIFVDTAQVASTDFNLTREDQLLLYNSGKEAAKKFFSKADPTN